MSIRAITRYRAKCDECGIPLEYTNANPDFPDCDMLMLFFQDNGWHFDRADGHVCCPDCWEYKQTQEES